MAKKRSSSSKTKKGAKQVERPLYLEEIAQQIPFRDALTGTEDIRLQYGRLFGSKGRPEVDCELDRVENGKEEGDYALNVIVRGADIGRHVLPPEVQIQQFEAEHNILDRQKAMPEFTPHLPDHLCRRAFPNRLPDYLKTARRLNTGGIRNRDEDETHEATTIFGADDRYTFFDPTYPWCTVGLVQTPLGSASGVMVGPRHLLTCSHAIQWNSNNTAGWVKFTPSSFDGSAPFGEAWGQWVYWEGQKVFGPTINRSEGQHDYVTVVLNWRIGDVTGWMGSRSWSDSWDGGTYWSHIGYPGDLGGQRPSFQNSIALDGSFWDREVHTRIFHKADVWPGQSGGPFFGWWAGDVGPRVVCVQSGENSDENSASGGAHMVDTIIRARNDHP